MSWVLVFVGFSALIILHEFGHFVVAKWTGMRVERFFLFFPPKLVSIRRGETEYGIGAIPLGGFVKITGMNPEEVEPRDPTEEARPPGLLEKVESVDQEPGPGVSKPGEALPPELLERAYYNQRVWKRIVVIAAGPAMNVLVAFALLFGLAFTLQEPTGNGLEISEVESDSPAKAQLQEGDRIISVDGVTGANLDLEDRASALREQIGSHRCAGELTDGCQATTPARIVIERDGRRMSLSVTPRFDEAADRTLIGYVQRPADLTDLNPSPPEAAHIALDRIWFVTSRSVSIFARLFDPEQREQVSGIVGVSYVGNQAIGFGATEALTLLAVVSLSLAIINLFPFLPLDGGHIFWSLVEKVRGRRVPFSVIERASAVGILLVLFLFFIGLSNDIDRLTGEGFNVR